MRDIKFRGKRIDNGEWVYGLFCREVTKSGCTVPCIQKEHESDSGDWIENIEIDGATLGQYTGLKDKNGKEIYEGDILNAPVTLNQERFGNRQYYVVGNLDGQYILTVRYIPKLKIALRDGYQFGYLCKILGYGENGYRGEDDDIEVIGNIHDNPELLEVTK
jgi:uncharacterized phage protein (TIGR01671 family)